MRMPISARVTWTVRSRWFEMRGQRQLRSDRAEQMVFLPARLDDHFRLLVWRIRTRSFTCTGMRRVALGLRFRPRSIGASNLRTSGSLMKSLWIVSRDSCHSAATCFGVWNCSSAGYHLPEKNFSSPLYFLTRIFSVKKPSFVAEIMAER